jgi:hypothetical protein
MIVLMAIGMVAVIACVALVIDGGNAWAQRRIVQNGSDAIAQAGGIVLAQRFAGVTAPPSGWDAEVDAKIHSIATANKIDIGGAYYTDICGIPLQADGSKSLNPDGSEDLAHALPVGTGALPGGTATTPDCPNLQVGPVAGVMVFGTKTFATYLSGVLGLNTFTATTRATAVTGYLQGVCDATLGNGCAVLPVTVPVNVITCDGHHDPLDTGTPWVLNQVYVVPLCTSGPGNVGWIDWDGGGGGVPELEDSILHPNNPPIDLPSWQEVPETGDINSGQVEDALRTYDGQVVMIPQFDHTCDAGHHGTPNSTIPTINTAPNYGCPAGGIDSGHGTNLWYRMPSFAYFQLCGTTVSACTTGSYAHGAYVQGDNRPICDTGNGATGCLVGRFVEILGSGTVGPGVGGGTTSTKAGGIQLIR